MSTLCRTTTTKANAAATVDEEDVPGLFERQLSLTFSNMSVDMPNLGEDDIDYAEEQQQPAGADDPWITMETDEPVGGLQMPPDEESPRPSGDRGASHVDAAVAEGAAAAPTQRPPPAGVVPPRGPPPQRVASPVSQAADPTEAGRRFGMNKLGVSAGNKQPCPVLTWVAAIVYCIATDSEISGGTGSLAGIITGETVLEGGDGSQRGLSLKFSGLKGPQGDLICRIARKVMQAMGKRDGMFRDWEALRKHLCENKGIDPGTGEGQKIKNFSFLWTGKKRGGNKDKDHTQTYFERAFTPDLDDDDKFTPAQRDADRKAGGGGNPGLMAHCGMLLQRDHPGMYEAAKNAALADIANGLQEQGFRETEVKAANDKVEAERKAAENPVEQMPNVTKEDKQARKTRTKYLTKKRADAKNAKAHIVDAAAVKQSPAFLRWAERNEAAIARSYLASEVELETADIEKVAAVFAQQRGPSASRFTVRAVNGLILAAGGVADFRRQVREGSFSVPTATATSAAAAPAPAPGASKLSRQRSEQSEVNDDNHRDKRWQLSKGSSKQSAAAAAADDSSPASVRSDVMSPMTSPTLGPPTATAKAVPDETSTAEMDADCEIV